MFNESYSFVSATILSVRDRQRRGMYPGYLFEREIEGTN